MSFQMPLKFLIQVSYVAIVSVVCFLFLFIEGGMKCCCRVECRIKEKDHVSMSANDLIMLHSHLGFWKHFRGFPSHYFPRNWTLVLFSITFFTSENTLLWSSNKLYGLHSPLATSLYYFFHYSDDLQKGTHKLTNTKTLVMKISIKMLFIGSWSLRIIRKIVDVDPASMAPVIIIFSHINPSCIYAAKDPWTHCQ